MKSGEIAVLAAFQGVTPGGRITTLGRGAAGTSAVAVAAAINVDCCDIYTDVDGMLEPIGNIPPAEAEQRYCATLDDLPMAA